MKKIFCLFFVLFCGVYMFSDENMSDNTKLIQSLQDENAQLKEMIYNKAFVNINGDVVEINGLVRGFSLAYSKYLQALDKLEKNGNLIVEFSLDPIYSCKRLFYGLNKKGRYYFQNEPVYKQIDSMLCQIVIIIIIEVDLNQEIY